MSKYSSRQKHKHRVRADVVRCLNGAITRPQFCDGVGRLVGYPKARSVKCDASGSCSGGKGAQDGAIAGAEFGHSIVEKVCNPDISAIVGGLQRRPSYPEGALICSVDGSQFGDCAIILIDHPNICSIKREANRPIAHREILENSIRGVSLRRNDHKGESHSYSHQKSSH